MSGLHIILDAKWTRLLSNRAAVEAWVREAAGLSGMTILAMVGYDLRIAFEQEPGVSVVALIAESHISVHTWPETGHVTMDMYSCRPFPAEPVLEGFRRTFGVSETLKEYRLERFGVGFGHPLEA